MKLIRDLFDKAFNIRRDSLGRNITRVIDSLENQYGGCWSYSVDDKWYECHMTGSIKKCYEVKDV